MTTEEIREKAKKLAIKILASPEILSVESATSAITDFAISLKEGEWVSVTDAFPNNGDKVLINQDGSKILCALFRKRNDGKSGFFYYDIHTEDLEPIEAVTHWMPLPQPPKQ